MPRRDKGSYTGASSIASILAIALLAGCNRSEEAAKKVAASDVVVPPDESGALPAAMTGSEFANTIAGGDAFEIAASNLARQKSTAAPVRLFADQMIEAHTTSGAKLRQAAAEASPPIKVESGLPADLQVKLDALRGLSGAAFDQQFAQSQVAAHEAALAALKSYGASGDVVSLKGFALEESAGVSDHLDMARKLAR